MRSPDQCQSMKELRVEINALDAQLIALLAERATYIDRAIELKPAEGIPARANDRVTEVLANVRALATEGGLDPDLAEGLWQQLIEWSILREEVVLGSGETPNGA